MFCFVFLVFALGVALGAPTEELPVLGIVGGERANQKFFNFQVSLELNGAHHCGGTLVSPNIVVTAAHCTQNIPPYFFQVRVGSASRERGGVVHKVENIIDHEDFTFETLHSDVAIVKLATNAKLSKTVGTLPMESQEPRGNTKALISGWGLTEEDGNLANELLFAKVTIFDRKYCEQRLRSFTEHMICAGKKEGGVDTCQADSGGPLVSGGKLAGIVSWGNGCARKGSPGVYTNVAKMRDWISAAIATILRRNSRYTMY